MKHDAWLRDAARESYYASYIEDDADFVRAEPRRELAYLSAVEHAFEMRAADRDWMTEQRQLPLF